MTVDPDTGDLVVQLNEAERFKLERVPAGGGPGRPIPIEGDFRLVPRPLTPGAIRGSRLLLSVASIDSWFWHIGLLDLNSGRVEKIPVDYLTDFHFATWAPDGSVLGFGLGIRSALWRFTAT